MVKSVLKRLLLPTHWWGIYKASRGSGRPARYAEDPQLKLYDQILQTDFLHYGYFANPAIVPEKISLYDMREAQRRYARLILDQVYDDTNPVLDVGCGMGGLIGMLLKRNSSTVGVTPDRLQINYIYRKYPQARLVHARYQNMKTDDYKAYFGTIIHSESLQYMSLDKAIENTLKMLKPGGRWIVVDYFRLGNAYEKSGHLWSDFLHKTGKSGLRIINEQDITKNIQPTLAYIFMWGKEIGKPLFEFLVEKLKHKHPGKYYVLQDMVEQMESKINKQLNIVNPDIFVQDKKYTLMTLEKPE